jgi:hypothetical protein
MPSKTFGGLRVASREPQNARCLFARDTLWVKRFRFRWGESRPEQARLPDHNDDADHRASARKPLSR